MTIKMVVGTENGGDTSLSPSRVRFSKRGLGANDHIAPISRLKRRRKAGNAAANDQNIRAIDRNSAQVEIHKCPWEPKF